MLITYEHLNTSDLRGTSLADYLVAIDADVQILDDKRLVYSEPSFPVVELARDLLGWLSDPARGDFAFESMSFEEVGAVTVGRVEAGWVFSSVFPSASAGSPVAWREADQCIRQFIARVEDNLRELR